MMDIVEKLRDSCLATKETHEAAAEIEDLRIKVKILEMDYRNSIQESLILGNAWKSGVDEIERLREALKFYANEDHYEPQKVWTTSMPQYEPDGYKMVTPIHADKGTRARAVIAKATGSE